MKLQQKFILIGVLPVLLITLMAILLSNFRLRKSGETALIAKSTAILSRMEAVRSFVGSQQDLIPTINETKNKYPDRNIPATEREIIRKKVPIIASWIIGEANAAQENYDFKIAAKNPRNPKNKASDIENQYLEKFKTNPRSTMTYTDKKNNQLWVMRAVFLNKSENCLACHGHPSTSPWGNGKDILGYDMENWSDNDMHGMFIIKSDLEPLQKEIQKSTLSIMFWGSLFAVIAIFISLFFFKKITNTINRIINLSKKVSNGDLSEKIKTESADELGQLSGNINSMTDSLATIISHVRDLSINLLNATNEISNSSSIISDGAQEQASQFEELTSSVHNTAEMASNATEISQKSVKNAQEANQGMQQLAMAMEDIQNSSKQINQAVKIISDIAFQTNLLALNASVEAARAGEHGKGFAVVANEVKKLAERSGESAKMVERVVKQNGEQIINSVAATKQASKQITDIIKDINEMAAELATINLSTQEQSEGMQKNSEITINNASSAEELASSANELNQQALELEEIIKKFKL